jgi:hypothetical protein
MTLFDHTLGSFRERNDNSDRITLNKSQRHHAQKRELEHRFSIQDRGDKNRFFRRDVALQRLYSQLKLVVLPKRNRFFAITESML